jgi:ABC-type transport system involved in multi-copper enzyme maturation permease subunit
MKKIVAIVEYTVKENIRHKIFYTILLFGLVIIVSSVLFSMLSGEEETRVILDIGLGAIEILAFLTAIFAAVGLVLGEMENRSISLILTRPVRRFEYIWGRYIGILSISSFNILLMSSGLLILLFIKGWRLDFRFLLAVTFIFLKVIMISALAILISLASTSPISSISATFFLWVLGHVSDHLKYLNHVLVEKGIRITIFLKAIYYLLPNFQYFNVKDYIGYPASLSGTTILWQLVYSLAYASVAMWLSVLIFSRKEFS